MSGSILRHFFRAAPTLSPPPCGTSASIAPVSQMSDRTAFLLESEATGPPSISTPDGWLVEVEHGQLALDRNSVTIKTYFASGPGEELDASKYDWDWNSPTSRARTGCRPRRRMRDSIFPGRQQGPLRRHDRRQLLGLGPRPCFPPMEFKPTSGGRSRPDRSARSERLPSRSGDGSAGSHVHLLLDRKALTTAYPQLTVSGGKGAKIRLTYSEASVRQAAAQSRPRCS